SYPILNEVIGLGITKYRHSNYILNLNVPEFENLEVLLRDNYLDNETLLTPNEITAYEFSVDPNNASSASNRFELLFNESTLSLSSTNDLANQVSLYPNPNSGQFNVYFPKTSTSKVEISMMSTLGQLVTKSTHYLKNQTISLNPKISTGVYILHFKIEDHAFTKKLIIK
ncbi:MAG: T9SS type A sorting domain-containing protein, partial [Psychroflexus salarius]